MKLDWNDHDTDVDWQELSDLYRDAGMGDKPARHLEGVFGASRYRVLVRRDGRIVGAGRAVSDGADVAYLADIAVHPDLQGLGVGGEIVERLLDAASGHAKVLLYANPGKEAFYGRYGFAPMRTAMALFEDPASAAARGFIDSPQDGTSAERRLRNDRSRRRRAARATT
ncbi:MAG: GNAT family N-acetyltransferase [Planctomycetota bacterium]